ncbi:MAG TPA: M17 family peptidase N-terminal domain-containing protein, partial [Proteiniclasticum sp.]|nr:M17 family peptidase N-terminal domain-containing protein [Proteiniclasticum sp.]
MKITIGQNHDAELILVCKDQELEGLEKVLNQLKDKGLFKGDEEELFSHMDMENNKIRIFLGLGEKDKVDEEILRLAAFKGAKELSKMKVKAASAVLPELEGLDY